MTAKESRPELEPEAAKETVKLDGATTDSVTEPPDIDAWTAERVAAREAQHAQRRAWLDQANAEHREARAHGLRARHARKLARGGERDG